MVARVDAAATNRLSRRPRELPNRVGRLKTGTPPRIDGRTIDFTALESQPGDDPRPVFSFIGSPRDHPTQAICHITYTNESSHDIIRSGLDRSPMYNGSIESVGPRYCPSIEDKVVRFAGKTAHQIFVEPEGLSTSEVYPNGISTSLPFDIQYALVRSIVGFENAVITRPGYAIEYDYFDPRDIEGLFFAGQINGTTGYEEAAAQGIVAGINAALRHVGADPWYPKREQAYIGVLVDDLVTRGTAEPYRMFTSRAEYRLLLREDSADQRLTPRAHELGLIDDSRWQALVRKSRAIEAEQSRLECTWLSPDKLDPERAEDILGQGLRKDQSLAQLLRRPEIDYATLMRLPGAGRPVDDAGVIEQLENNARYAGYIERMRDEIERNCAHEDTPIPPALDYDAVRGLSREVSQKLCDHRPATIAQAARISGVTPAAISLLLVHLKKGAGRLARSA